ncbi:unnamed protein product [Adineta ricciae]|uniref:Uncharacterized protein n=1 Tax=Adineta ricciae TaxID=249248 RepID=A0A814JCA7_ADIRI|nr:unnamed protein product [Adineta ricciae]CAF1470158.1 unnamed protein product [Adineta ricciae]
MSQDTCTFSYISIRDCQPKIATGIERAWLDLKLEFSRQGEGLAGAKYYKTVSLQGPQLFAVKFDQTVWYHDNNEWHRYITATDIKYGVSYVPELNPRRDTFASTTTDGDDEPEYGVQNED